MYVKDGFAVISRGGSFLNLSITKKPKNHEKKEFKIVAITQTTHF